MYKRQVLDPWERLVPHATVTLELPSSVLSKKTDFSGLAHFSLAPTLGNPATVKAKCDDLVTQTQSVILDQWSSNSIVISLPASSLSLERFDVRHYPNPVVSGGTIHLLFNIKTSGFVQIDLYDFNLRLIKRIVDEQQVSGEHSVSFIAKDENGKNLERGLYYGVLRSGGEKKVIKIMVK